MTVPEFFALSLIKNDLTLFAPYRRILFLASGKIHGDAAVVKIAAKYAEKAIVAADLDPGTTVSPRNNLRVVVADNRQRLPFPDQSFDLVYLHAGLCLHEGAQPGETCGGIPLAQTEAEPIFKEMVRVLDRGTPFSAVILHGAGPPEFLGHWDIPGRATAAAYPGVMYKPLSVLIPQRTPPRWPLGVAFLHRVSVHREAPND